MCAGASPTSGATGTSNVPSSATAANGIYVIGGIAPGTYRVRFSDCVGSVELRDGVLRQHPERRLCHPRLGCGRGHDAGINAGLAIAGRISGTVVADADGRPAGRNLRLPVLSAATAPPPVRPRPPMVLTPPPGLPPALYTVRFEDCVGTVDYVTEYYNNKPDFSSSDVCHGDRGGHHLRDQRRHGRRRLHLGHDRRGRKRGSPLASMCAAAFLLSGAGAEPPQTSPSAADGYVHHPRRRCWHLQGAVQATASAASTMPPSTTTTPRAPRPCGSPCVRSPAVRHDLSESTPCLAVAGRISGTVVRWTQQALHWRTYAFRQRSPAAARASRGRSQRPTAPTLYAGLAPPAPTR